MHRLEQASSPSHSPFHRNPVWHVHLISVSQGDNTSTRYPAVSTKYSLSHLKHITRFYAGHLLKFYKLSKLHILNAQTQATSFCYISKCPTLAITRVGPNLVLFVASLLTILQRRSLPPSIYLLVVAARTQRSGCGVGMRGTRIREGNQDTKGTMRRKRRTRSRTVTRMVMLT